MTDDPQQGKQEPQIVYVKQAGNGFAVAALCVGIAAVAIGGAMYILFPNALGLGGVAIVLGAVGRHKAKEPGAGRKTMATWGLALGVVALMIGSAGAAAVDEAVRDFDREIEEADRQFEQDMQEADREAEQMEREAAEADRQFQEDMEREAAEADRQFEQDMEEADREFAEGMESLDDDCIAAGTC